MLSPVCVGCGVACCYGRPISIHSLSFSGTGATVRVLIESTDGDSIWWTVGFSENIIQASWNALVDSIDYKLQKDLVDRT